MAAHGSRLAFVTRKVNGKIKRTLRTWDAKAKEIKTKEVVVDAGYFVYFPAGHYIHVPDEATLVKAGFNRPPKIVDLSGIHDPNSAIGQVLFAQDSQEREDAYAAMEQNVIDMVHARVGQARFAPEVEFVENG